MHCLSQLFASSPPAQMDQHGAYVLDENDAPKLVADEFKTIDLPFLPLQWTLRFLNQLPSYQSPSHVLCRPHDAATLPSRCRRRARAARPRCVPPPAYRGTCDRPPQPAMAEGVRHAAHVCAAGDALRSRRDGHALCPRCATALPGRRRRRARAVLATCVPLAAHSDCCGTNTRCAARATRAQAAMMLSDRP